MLILLEVTQLIEVDPIADCAAFDFAVLRN